MASSSSSSVYNNHSSSTSSWSGTILATLLTITYFIRPIHVAIPVIMILYSHYYHYFHETIGIGTGTASSDNNVTTIIDNVTTTNENNTLFDIDKNSMNVQESTMHFYFYYFLVLLPIRFIGYSLGIIFLISFIAPPEVIQGGRLRRGGSFSQRKIKSTKKQQQQQQERKYKKEDSNDDDDEDDDDDENDDDLHHSQYLSILLLCKLFYPLVQYFDYDEIIENTPINIHESIVTNKKQYIYACQPHGIVPFCSLVQTIKHAQRLETKVIKATRQRKSGRNIATQQQKQNHDDEDVMDHYNDDDVMMVETTSSRKDTSASSSTMKKKNKMKIERQKQHNVLIPTAVATMALYTPVLKHILALFGCISMSQMKQQISFQQQKQKRKELKVREQRKRQLLSSSSSLQGNDNRKKNDDITNDITGEDFGDDNEDVDDDDDVAKGISTVRIYLGSTAEIFFCNERLEVLHLSKRKKFIYIALQLGVDIIPVYMFGNTSIFSVWENNPLLIALSTLMNFPVSYIWGRYYLPIPRKKKLLYVTGQPLGMKHIKRPGQIHIDYWYDRYCEQVERLYYQYRHRVPDYKDKKLLIV